MSANDDKEQAREGYDTIQFVDGTVGIVDVFKVDKPKPFLVAVLIRGDFAGEDLAVLARGGAIGLLGREALQLALLNNEYIFFFLFSLFTSCCGHLEELAKR